MFGQITYFSLRNDWIASWKFSNEVIHGLAEFLGHLIIALQCLFLALPTFTGLRFFSPFLRTVTCGGENRSNASITQSKTVSKSQSH